ncbi:MAG: hypothetical protein HY879_20515 [Deltaproteobacteria bacterium]|nr:hypothetical protein [Deltaproteobacteria bacterium]
MAEASRGKGAIKFIFWGVVAAGLFYYAFHTYNTGQMVAWYYYKSNAEGYAVNADNLKNATKGKPALLEIGSFEKIEGLQAVPVKKGDRLPINANGIITKEQLKKGERATVEDKFVKVTVPVKIREAKGFKYKDTFKHKGIQTNPWAAAWNVGLILVLGFSLGLLAEGFTDMFGLKLEKIDHFEGAH